MKLWCINPHAQGNAWGTLMMIPSHGCQGPQRMVPPCSAVCRQGEEFIIWATNQCWTFGGGWEETNGTGQHIHIYQHMEGPSHPINCTAILWHSTRCKRGASPSICITTLQQSERVGLYLGGHGSVPMKLIIIFHTARHPSLASMPPKAEMSKKNK